MRKYSLVAVMLTCFFSSFSQIDSAFIAKIKSLDTANILKMDTAAVPNDHLTKKINELRKERNGLNIQTVIKLKISEEQAKDTLHPKQFYTQLLDEITTGETGILLNNSIINLYRRTYTEHEINNLIKFYKTSAGKKMNNEYFILLIESVKDAEYLLKKAAAKVEQAQKKT